MNRIKLLFVHSDKKYTQALSRAMALRDPLYTVSLAMEDRIYSRAALEEAAKKDYDFILVDEDWKRIADQEKAKGHEIMLGLSEVPVDAEIGGYVYKYGGLKNICSEIQMAYSDKTGKKRTYLNFNKTDLIGFTSASGGAGTSCIAISTARELISMGEKDILYLSLEDTESTPAYIAPDEGKGTISEYLYYLFAAKNQAACSYMDSFIISDQYGLYAFRPSKGINELPGLSPDNLFQFLNSILKTGRFQHIVLDLPARMTDNVAMLLKYSHKLILIDDGMPLSVWKNKCFLENISPELYEEIKRKTIKVTNKWIPGEEIEIADDRLFVESDEDSFTMYGNIVDIKLHRRFGVGVRGIADELTAKI